MVFGRLFYLRSALAISVHSPCLVSGRAMYEACPESKDTKVLNMYTIFNLQNRHCE